MINTMAKQDLIARNYNHIYAHEMAHKAAGGQFAGALSIFWILMLCEWGDSSNISKWRCLCHEDVRCPPKEVSDLGGGTGRSLPGGRAWGKIRKVLIA